MKIPAGFQPVTLERMLYHFRNDAPELGKSLFEHLARPEEEAAALIVSLEQRGLVQFAIAPTGEPSVFVANDISSKPERAFADDLVSFWDATGKFDAVHGRIVSEDIPEPLATVFTPEGPVTLVQRVAQRLYKLGLITEDAQQRLVAPSKTQLYAWTEEQGICDFCSEDQPKHVVMVPSFDMVPGLQGVPRSEGGWMACDTCHGMVTSNQRTDLLRRAIEKSRGGRFTAASLEGLHKRFWKQYDLKSEAAGIGAAFVDFIEDRIQPELEFTPAMKDKARRAEAIRRMTGLAPDEMEALQRGDVLHKETVQKLTEWRKKYQIGITTAEGQRRVQQFLEAFDRPAPPSLVPHWQQALDRKSSAMHLLMKAIQQNSDVTFPEAVDLKDPALLQAAVEKAAKIREFQKLGYAEDLLQLKTARTYSFSTDIMEKIQQATHSIPHESPLSAVTIPPVSAGFFWFQSPMPTASSHLTDQTMALLWGWQSNNGAKHLGKAMSGEEVPVLRMTTFVQHEDGTLLPTTKWTWPLNQTFHQMLGRNVLAYRKLYGPGAPYEHLPNLAGEEAMIKCVTDLSLFFLASCTWFKQKILIETPGHIERHARKRYMKEHKTTTPPEVQVIALRASETRRSPEGGDVAPRKYDKWSWIVDGHFKLQRCGPGGKDRKLIFVGPYPKGDPTKPLKPKAEKVYAVIR